MYLNAVSMSVSQQIQTSDYFRQSAQKLSPLQISY